jgi:3-oxoacyl-[acyl-carrier protein] reductase
VSGADSTGRAASRRPAAGPLTSGRTVSGRTVLVAGATSVAGQAVSAGLVRAGARVIVVGSHPGRLGALHDAVPGVSAYPCDLGDFAAVTHLADTVHAEHGMIDGLIHLVGGWRGGGGLVGQNDEDWAFLHRNIVVTLRNTTRAFNADLLASPAGRLAIVSSVSVDNPTPGGANYAAAKSAAETWTRAVGHGFAKAGGSAATAIFTVRALDGLEHQLAGDVVALWDRPATDLNNTRIPLR